MSVSDDKNALKVLFGQFYVVVWLKLLHFDQNYTSLINLKIINENR